MWVSCFGFSISGAQLMPQRNLCHNAIYAIAQLMPQRNLCHSAIYATAQSMPRRKLCHSAIYATVQSMPQRNLCHSATYATAQSMPRRNGSTATFSLKSRLRLTKLLLRPLLGTDGIVGSREDT